MSALVGTWFIRPWRIGVALTRTAVVLRGQIRTRRFHWEDIAAPQLLTMRTVSPFAAWFPYVCLGLQLTDGRVIRFDDFSAAASRSYVVEQVVDEIRRRTG